MTYAIIEIQGKQYKVTPGQKISVDRLDAKEGDILPLEKVLMVVDGTDTKIGTPYLSIKDLSAKVIEHNRGEKIRVAKYKAKSRYRKVQGHRQDLTTIEVQAKAAKAASKAEAKPAKKTSTTSKKSK